MKRWMVESGAKIAACFMVLVLTGMVIGAANAPTAKPMDVEDLYVAVCRAHQPRLTQEQIDERLKTLTGNSLFFYG